MFCFTRSPRFCFSFSFVTPPVPAGLPLFGAALSSLRFSQSIRFTSNPSPGSRNATMSSARSSSITTFVLQEGSTGSIAQLPFGWRLQNALVSYVTYIWQTIWPADLAVFYPHPENHLALWQVASSAAFLLAITLFVFLFRRTR